MKYINQLFFMFSGSIANETNSFSVEYKVWNEIETRKRILDEMENYKKQTLIKQMILKNRYELCLS